MSNKYEKEIEEIINQKGDFLIEDHLKDSGRSSRNDNRSSIASLLSRGITFLLQNRSRMMLASIAILLIFSLIFGSTIPVIGTFFVFALIILFLASYFLSFVRFSSHDRQKRWRGELIESPRHNFWLGRLSTILRRIGLLR